MRVLVLDDHQHVAHLGDWGAHDVTFSHEHLDGQALLDRLQGFPVVVAMRERTPFPRELLEQLPDLRLFVTTGMRNAAIDLVACADRGVTVCGTGGVDSSTSEHTWALILGLARHVAEEDAAVRAGRWQTTVGVGLEGKTLGLLGPGRLGGQVARIGQAFGMRCLAWSQHLTQERADEVGAELGSYEDLLRRSDILTIHLKLSDRTQGLVGAAELALMKPTGLLINTSRGPIVDERALIEALQHERLAGAALDVFDVEPLPAESPLRTAPRTLLTPHVGYVTQESYARFWREAVEDIDAWIAGEPVRELRAGT